MIIRATGTKEGGLVSTTNLKCGGALPSLLAGAHVGGDGWASLALGQVPCHDDRASVFRCRAGVREECFPK